ncbi:unnamed protein product [Schistosoma spindalis]|nr:unnamed protein product [Schistosoma spindale]
MGFTPFLFFLLIYSQCLVVKLSEGGLNQLNNVEEFVGDQSKYHDIKDNANPGDKDAQSIRNSETHTTSIDQEKDVILSRKDSHESLDSSDNQESSGEVHSSGGSIMPPGTNQESAGLDHKDVQESILKELPSLDSVAAESINTHEIPTFNEFHAMVSERSQSRKGQDCEVVGNVGVTDSDYDINIKQKIKASQIPQGSEKLPQTHIDVNPSVKSSRNQIVQDVPEKSVFTDDSSFSDNIQKDSTSEQHQPLQVDSVVTSNSETNSKPSSHITSQPVITTTTAATTITNNDAVHTPSKIDLTLRRNVASVACGAKMLGFSRAIKNPEAVLNENNDEYMNVPCSEEKWLILEVCQPVHLRTIELANFELFSSRLKSFRVYAIDRYPAKSWELIGTFTARDVKGIQSFSVFSGKMIKYVKFELIEHYGSEHYCPLSMIRIFGLGSDDLDDDDDVDDVDVRLMNVPESTSNHDSTISSTKEKDQHLEDQENDLIAKDNNAKNEHKDDQTSLNTSNSNDGMYDTTEIMEDNNHHIVNVSTYDPEMKSTNSDLTSEDDPNNQNDDHDHEHVVNKLSNIDSPNSDSSLDSSTASHTDDTTSDHHHKLLRDQSKKYSERATTEESIENHNDNYKNKFCGKIDPIKVLHKPFCPAGSILYRSINHYIHDYSITTNCHTSNIVNSDLLISYKSNLDSIINIPSKTSATIKLPLATVQIKENNKLLQNISIINLTLKLHNKLFYQTFNQMNIITRLINVIKRNVFGIFSQFFPSAQDTTNLILHDIIPTLENFHTINYLFNPIGLFNPLCKDSMMYLTINQIEGLWSLRKCLILLDLQYTSTDSHTLTLLNSINPIKIKECLYAINQLNLTVITNLYYLQSYSQWSLYELDKSIEYLFIAYYIMQHNKTLIPSSLSPSLSLSPSPSSSSSSSSYCIECKSFTYLSLYDINCCCELFHWNWKTLNIFLWNNTIDNYKCFKLPSFLLSNKYSELSSSSSPSSFKSPVIPDLIDSTDNNINEKIFIENYPHSADMIIQNRNSKSSNSFKSSSSSSSTSSIKSHKINRPHSHNEALVVPAALGGSHRSTAYMRLNNRVRIIERNVSVSMRYLEELSQSYRRQMERLSRSFNLTYAWLKVTAHSAEERDRQQQHRISQLELQLNDLTARLKSRLLNSLPASSSSGQPDLTLTSSPLSSTTSSSLSSSSSSSSESVVTTPANTGGTVLSSSTSKSSNLVASLTSPPPLPDFESSLDWNPWLKSQHDDWYIMVDGDMVVGNNNDDVDDSEFESDDSYQTNDDVYLSRLDVTTATLSKNYKEKFKQTTTGTTNSKSHHINSDNDGSNDNNIPSTSISSVSNNPNEYNAKSLFNPYLSTRDYKHQHYQMESSSSSLFSEWKQFVLGLLWLQFSWPVWLYNFGVFIHNFCQMNTMILNISSLIFLHLILASIVHLIIYWIWLRPKNHMISKFDTEFLLLLSPSSSSSSSSSNLYQVLYCKKDHQNSNSCIVYLNPMNSTQHITHLLPSININTTITNDDNNNSNNDSNSNSNIPHITDNVGEHRDHEYDTRQSLDKESSIILTNTMTTTTTNDNNNNPHITDNVGEHHDHEYDRRQSLDTASSIILTNTMTTTTTTNDNNNNNPHITDNVGEHPDHEYDRRQSFDKISNNTMTTTDDNGSNNNISVPKSFTSCQMNELFHTYKPTIEMTYNHQFMNTDFINENHHSILTNVYNQCIHNINSCCLMKGIQLHKIEGDAISSSEVKCDPQLKHLPSLLQLPTISSSSDNNQFNKDELKCGENDFPQSSICQLNGCLTQEYNKSSNRSSPDHYHHHHHHHHHNDLEDHLCTSTHVVTNFDSSSTTFMKNITKSMNHNNHKRKHKRKRDLDNNGSM